MRRHTVPFVFSRECVARRGEDNTHERDLDTLSVARDSDNFLAPAENKVTVLLNALGLPSLMQEFQGQKSMQLAPAPMIAAEFPGIPPLAHSALGGAVT